MANKHVVAAGARQRQDRGRDIEPTPLISVAIEAVQDAARIALKERAAGFSKRAQKSAVVDDIVTSGDEASQTFLEARLPRHFIAPGTDKQEEIGFLGEEQLDAGRTVPKHAAWRWCVDPVDGTKAYDKGDPHWSVAVALQKRPTTPGQRWNTALTTVYCSDARDTPDRLSGKVYWAEVNKGAYILDLSTGITERLQKPAVIAPVAEFEVTPEADTPQAHQFAREACGILQARGITPDWRRSIGYAAMEVLEGKKAAVVQGTTGPYEWDLAFELLANEAGAKIAVTPQGRTQGKDRYSTILAWDGELFDHLNEAAARAHQVRAAAGDRANVRGG